MAIKMTIYRLAKDSKDHQVLYFVQQKMGNMFPYIWIKARFDEENNIPWSEKTSKRLAVLVIYGIFECKTSY